MIKNVCVADLMDSLISHHDDDVEEYSLIHLDSFVDQKIDLNHQYRAILDKRMWNVNEKNVHRGHLRSVWS